MKILVVGREPRTHSMLEGLLASPLWRVTHCPSSEDAYRELEAANEPFDYILVEPGDGGFGNGFKPPSGQDCGRAPVVYVDWRGDRIPEPGGDGVYGLYPVGFDGDDSGGGEGQWIFEYHAPCRREG